MIKVTVDIEIANANDAHYYVPAGYKRNEYYEKQYHPYYLCKCGESPVQCYINDNGDSYTIGICEYCGIE